MCIFKNVHIVLPLRNIIPFHTYTSLYRMNRMSRGFQQREQTNASNTKLSDVYIPFRFFHNIFTMTERKFIFYLLIRRYDYHIFNHTFRLCLVFRTLILLFICKIGFFSPTTGMVQRLSDCVCRKPRTRCYK